MLFPSAPGKVKAYLKTILLCLLSCGGGRGDFFAQSSALWPLVETRLGQPGGDTARHFILQLVRGQCGEDSDCLYQNYYAIMIGLERRFNLPAAIFVGEEMVAIAGRQQDLRREADVHMHLDRYFSAVGIHGKAVFHIERAIDLFEQLNDHPALNRAKFVKLEESLSYLPLEQALPGFDELLANARQNKDTSGITYMLTRMIDVTLSARHYDDALNYIDALDQFSVSKPSQSFDRYFAIIVAFGRAKLAYARNDLDEAALYFQQALRFSRERPDPWHEINTLNLLSELEWKRGDRSLAKSHLEEAQGKAEELELHDLLSGIFQLKMQYAEEEGRYAEALSYTKQRYAYDQKLEERNAGFDIQNYYLQLEKDQLATEKKNQQLALSQKSQQLRNSLIITVLVFLLAAGLFIGLYKQRQGKRELTAQNALIREQSEQLKTLDQAKSRFFANVSHELRTPLTLILGPIQTLLKGGQLNEKQTKLLNTADQSGRQLQELVSEILDLRKLEMGKMGVNLQPVALGPFFKNQFTQFESLAERKGISFIYETTIDDTFAAHIDPAKCRQILNNLLSNAFKFTPQGGHIRASLSANAGMLKLEVADSGPGIHPDDLPHVFDRFFQTSRPDKPAEGGTGIGLALCMEYARLFGGDIEVESAVGKGAVFRVKWPVEVGGSVQSSVFSFQLSEESGEVSQFFEEKPDGSRPTILVVEDNPELQDYIRLILSEKYHVLTAGNGEEALNRTLKIENCRLILSDLMMPVMDGFQLLEALKSDDATRHIPVIMLTARAEARDKLKALRIGVDDYITKPFDEEELLVRIENLLNNQTARFQDVPEEAATPALSAADREWLERFETFVQKNLSNSILSIPMLADELAMSESTLLRQLKRLTGLTPVQYLQEVRLDRARRLLEDRTYDSIARVAAETGYNDARSFSRIFKQRFGKAPSAV
jgi:signal transduction histidine kinase/CheY-like chemotaxis protein/AraC-like DNA-binding protein